MKKLYVLVCGATLATHISLKTSNVAFKQPLGPTDFRRFPNVNLLVVTLVAIII